MTDVKIARALLSVSDKTGLVELGQALARHGVELVSTGGTAKALREAGLEVRDVSDLTGFPEMMDGRVKTLHPKVHGGLLGGARRSGACRGDGRARDRRDRSGRRQPLSRSPQTVAKGAARDEIIENIDIGGPSMVRSAAKNHAFVADRHRSRRLCRADRGARRERRHDVARSAQAAGRQGLRRHRRL